MGRHLRDERLCARCGEKVPRDAYAMHSDRLYHIFCGFQQMGESLRAVERAMRETFPDEGSPG